MEHLRIFQQRALRQLFQLRPALQRQTFRHVSQSPQQPFRTRTSNSFPQTSRKPRWFSPPSSKSSQSASKRFRSFQSSQPPQSNENLSVSQRLRKLSREYGWSALGVYLLLSLLDFPFCFLAVRMLGVDRIGHWEHVVLSYIKGWIKWPLSEENKDMVDSAVKEVKKAVKERIPLEEVEDGEKRLLEEDETYVVEDHGVAEAEKANAGENASIWTQLALAYAIHKSFIFIRVPLTAAVTPKVVKTLRGWGWNIGKRPSKSKKIAPGIGVNTGKTGVKGD